MFDDKIIGAVFARPHEREGEFNYSISMYVNERTYLFRWERMVNIDKVLSQMAEYERTLGFPYDVGVKYVGIFLQRYHEIRAEFGQKILETLEDGGEDAEDEWGFGTDLSWDEDDD